MLKKFTKLIPKCLKIFCVDISCCGIDILQIKGSRYNVRSYGIDFTDTIQNANVLIIGGNISQKIAPYIRDLYLTMSDPKWVISYGSCACNGGIYHSSYALVNSCSSIIPVNIFVAGCSGGPDALIYGLNQLKQVINDRMIV